MRDAGWMQLFAETNQEAVDLHVQAFRLDEELSMPVMVRNAFIGDWVGPKSRSATARALVVKAKSPKFS